MSMATTTGPSGQPAMEPEWSAESNLTRILAVSTFVHFVTFVLVCLRLYARVFCTAQARNGRHINRGSVCEYS